MSSLPLMTGLSLNGREKVIAKSGPLSLTCRQIVALIFPRPSVVPGRLDE
jgi:hypothetical protein